MTSPRFDLTYRILFQRILVRMDAERAHRLAASSLRVALPVGAIRRLVRRHLASTDPRLRVQTLGLQFPSPLGVAAGMDKNATFFRQLGALGFGHVEIGTVTAEQQPGNHGKRVWRLPEHGALVNRMGFPNHGAQRIARRLRRGAGETIVGANIGKTKNVPVDEAAADYAATTRAVAPYVDYLVINVSSPNTPGLRDMQAVELLEPLVAAVRKALAQQGTSVPLLVKIAPDLDDTDIDAIASLALDLQLDGIVAVNTTVNPAWLEQVTTAGEISGGISGAPLASPARHVLKRLRSQVGDRMVLISVGGVDTAQEALERIRAGATLVQVHTGFVFNGPLWPRRMNRELGRLVSEAGASSVQDLVGTAAEQKSFPLAVARA
jgi:dihydroorotate dehydrogenase